MAVCWLGWWWDADCLGHRGGCVSSGCVVSVEVSEEGSVGGWLVGELAWRIPKGGRTWSARGRVAPRLSYARQSDRRARGESRASPTIRPLCGFAPARWMRRRGAAAQDREGRQARIRSWACRRQRPFSERTRPRPLSGIPGTHRRRRAGSRQSALPLRRTGGR